MLDELSAHMKPPAAKDAAKKFRDFTYLTQVKIIFISQYLTMLIQYIAMDTQYFTIYIQYSNIYV